MRKISREHSFFRQYSYAISLNYSIFIYGGPTRMSNSLLQSINKLNSNVILSPNIVFFIKLQNKRKYHEISFHFVNRYQRHFSISFNYSIT